MKKLLFAILAIVFIASPAVADNWTINFTTQGDADHIVLFHGPISDGVSAEDLVNQTGLTEIQLPVSSPQEFTLDYEDGVQYGIFGVVYDAIGNSQIFMDEQGGDLSPIVWRATAIPEVVDAHYEQVVPSTDGVNVINITINQGR